MEWTKPWHRSAAAARRGSPGRTWIKTNWFAESIQARCGGGRNLASTDCSACATGARWSSDRGRPAASPFSL